MSLNILGFDDSVKLNRRELTLPNLPAEGDSFLITRNMCAPSRGIPRITDTLDGAFTIRPFPAVANIETQETDQELLIAFDPYRLIEPYGSVIMSLDGVGYSYVGKIDVPSVTNSFSSYRAISCEIHITSNTISTTDTTLSGKVTSAFVMNVPPSAPSFISLANSTSLDQNRVINSQLSSGLYLIPPPKWTSKWEDFGIKPADDNYEINQTFQIDGASSMSVSINDTSDNYKLQSPFLVGPVQISIRKVNTTNYYPSLALEYNYKLPGSSEYEWASTTISTSSSSGIFASAIYSWEDIKVKLGFVVEPEFFVLRSVTLGGFASNICEGVLNIQYLKTFTDNDGYGKFITSVKGTLGVRNLTIAGQFIAELIPNADSAQIVRTQTRSTTSFIPLEAYHLLFNLPDSILRTVYTGPQYYMMLSQIDHETESDHIYGEAARRLGYSSSQLGQASILMKLLGHIRPWVRKAVKTYGPKVLRTAAEAIEGWSQSTPVAHSIVGGRGYCSSEFSESDEPEQPPKLSTSSSSSAPPKIKIVKVKATAKRTTDLKAQSVTGPVGHAATCTMSKIKEDDGDFELTINAKYDDLPDTISIEVQTMLQVYPPSFLMHFPSESDQGFIRRRGHLVFPELLQFLRKAGCSLPEADCYELACVSGRDENDGKVFLTWFHKDGHIDYEPPVDSTELAAFEKYRASNVVGGAGYAMIAQQPYPDPSDPSLPPPPPPPVPEPPSDDDWSPTPPSTPQPQTSSAAEDTDQQGGSVLNLDQALGTNARADPSFITSETNKLVQLGLTNSDSYWIDRVMTQQVPLEVCFPRAAHFVAIDGKRGYSICAILFTLEPVKGHNYATNKKEDFTIMIDQRISKGIGSQLDNFCQCVLGSRMIGYLVWNSVLRIYATLFSDFDDIYQTSWGGAIVGALDGCYCSCVTEVAFTAVENKITIGGHTIPYYALTPQPVAGHEIKMQAVMGQPRGPATTALFSNLANMPNKFFTYCALPDSKPGGWNALLTTWRQACTLQNQQSLINSFLIPCQVWLRAETVPHLIVITAYKLYNHDCPAFRSIGSFVRNRAIGGTKARPLGPKQAVDTATKTQERQQRRFEQAMAAGLEELMETFYGLSFDEAKEAFDVKQFKSPTFTEAMYDNVMGPFRRLMEGNSEESKKNLQRLANFIPRADDGQVDIATIEALNNGDQRWSDVNSSFNSIYGVMTLNGQSLSKLFGLQQVAANGGGVKKETDSFVDGMFNLAAKKAKGNPPPPPTTNKQPMGSRQKRAAARRAKQSTTTTTSSSSSQAPPSDNPSTSSKGATRDVVNFFS